MARAVSVNELISYRGRVLDFDGEWFDLVGRPELCGSWLIWGGSTSGKTSFALQLAKYLSRFERVAYNSLEEGVSESMRAGFLRAGMEEVARRVVLLDRESIAELRERLARRKSQNVVIIDSLQYAQLTYADYRALKEQFPGKLFIFISHADGREPSGRVARAVRYDANVKIRVEGYRALCNSRYGGGRPYTIWDEGAARCWCLPTVEDYRQ